MHSTDHAAAQLRHLIASDVPLSATAEHVIATVAGFLERPDPNDAYRYRVGGALPTNPNDVATRLLDQTGPGMFRCVTCATAVATADVFAHRCRIAS